MNPAPRITALLINTGLQPGVSDRDNVEAVLTASRSDEKAAEAAPNSMPQHTGLKPGANEMNRDWLLWQLADSAFPTGGFAHSAGLEAAWQHGEVRNREELLSFVEASLHQLGRAALPFVTAAYAERDRLEEFDNLCDAFTTNHVANRASRAQGKAFLTAVQRIFVSSQMPVLRFGHFAPVFGACLSMLDVSSETTTRLFFFNHLRGAFAAAVRLNVIGPMEAQMLQHRLAPKAEEIIKTCESLTLDEIAQTSPLLDIWQGAQDRLYSRLFQS